MLKNKLNKIQYQIDAIYNKQDRKNLIDERFDLVGANTSFTRAVP